MNIARVLVLEEGPDGIFLNRFDESGKVAGDTWHASIDDARHKRWRSTRRISAGGLRFRAARRTRSRSRFDSLIDPRSSADITAAQMAIEAPATDSREMAFLDEMHERASQLIVRGTAAAALGAILLVARLFGHLGVVFGFVGVLGGPFFVLVGLLWFRLLPAARESLNKTPLEARLEVKRLRGGYGFNRSTMAMLWPADREDYWLAEFSETMHWQTPRFLTVNRVSARVYGTPTWGAAVVASCAEGVVVGRIRRSRFGKPPPPPKPESPLMAWLQKPRHLRLR